MDNRGKEAYCPTAKCGPNISARYFRSSAHPQPTRRDYSYHLYKTALITDPGVKETDNIALVDTAGFGRRLAEIIMRVRTAKKRERPPAGGAKRGETPTPVIVDEWRWESATSTNWNRSPQLEAMRSNCQKYRKLHICWTDTSNSGHRFSYSRYKIESALPNLTGYAALG